MESELTEQERSTLGRKVVEVFHDWELRPELQLTLLGIPDRKARELIRYKNGQPLPNENDLLARATHIVGIQRSLHANYPLNHSLPGFWIRNRNRLLRGIPLAIMVEGGLSGMHRVWSHLDCTRNWEE